MNTNDSSAFIIRPHIVEIVSKLFFFDLACMIQFGYICLPGLSFAFFFPNLRHQWRSKAPVQTANLFLFDVDVSGRLVSFLSLCFRKILVTTTKTKQKILNNKKFSTLVNILEFSIPRWLGLTSYWLTPASSVLFVYPPPLWLDPEISTILTHSTQFKFIQIQSISRVVVSLWWCYAIFIPRE